MDTKRFESSVNTHAAAFDSLSRSLSSRLPRRRVAKLFAAALATGGLGLVSHAPAAQAKQKHKNHGKHKGNNGNNGNSGVDIPTEDPQNASDLCLAVNNTCGSNANLLGRCRQAAAGDNDASLICTSDTVPNNPCVSSLQ